MSDAVATIRRMAGPADRLTAADLHDRVNRVEEAFAVGDDETEVVRGGRLRLVSTIDERLRQLVGVLVHIRNPNYAEAMELVDDLRRARISRGVDLSRVFGELRQVVDAWDAARQARRRAA